MQLDIKHSISQKISARVEQSIRILQMDAQELAAYLSELTLENPVFEIQYPDDSAIHSYDLFSDRRRARTSGQLTSGTDGCDVLEAMAAPEDHSLESHLLRQIRCTLSGRTAELVRYLASFLNDDGYLEPCFSQICCQSTYDSEELSQALRALQALDPPGIGASNLQECLYLQLAPDDALARSIIANHMNDVASDNLTRIARSLRTGKEQTEQAVMRVRALNPRPGASFFRSDAIGYVQPDIVVRSNGDSHLDITLTGAYQPVFHPNAAYLELARDSSDEALQQYLKTKIDQYKWICRCLETREQTLLALADVIVRQQSRFFKFGPLFLNTFRMSDAADLLGLHKSTVSRAVNGKWLLCEHGMFPLKYFFVRGLNSDSAEVSVIDAKQEIYKLISEEDPVKPLSDQIIADCLCERGIRISRRTVAKYRDQLGIPSAHLRVQRL